MFAGVYGTAVVPEAARPRPARAMLETEWEARPFEPIAGRPMTEYVTSARGDLGRRRGIGRVDAPFRGVRVLHAPQDSQNHEDRPEGIPTMTDAAPYDATRFDALRRPLRIGRLTAKNRIEAAPTLVCLAQRRRVGLHRAGRLLPGQGPGRGRHRHRGRERDRLRLRHHPRGPALPRSRQQDPGAQPHRRRHPPLRRPGLHRAVPRRRADHARAHRRPGRPSPRR